MASYILPALVYASVIILQGTVPGLAQSGAPAGANVTNVTYVANVTYVPPVVVPQPFNNTAAGSNQTLSSGGISLPPLAATTTPTPVPVRTASSANVSAKWEPIPHYKLPHYDPTGKVVWFPRIIGGAMATSGEFPAMVSLQLARNSAHICGGTLLSMSQILTAAHCVTDVRGVPSPPTQYQVMGDDLFILPQMGNPTRQMRPVRSIVVHPQYDAATIANDIAIVRVASEFRKTSTFYPGKRIQKTPTMGDRCSLAGWGVTTEHSTTMSPNLQRINVVISDFGSCNVAFDQQLTREMLCAGAPERDACQGDSGGALLCAGGRVAGIVSFGAGCAKPNVPGVYVDVVYYEKWINGVLKNGAQRDATMGHSLGLTIVFWSLLYFLRN